MSDLLESQDIFYPRNFGRLKRKVSFSTPTRFIDTDRNRVRVSGSFTRQPYPGNLTLNHFPVEDRSTNHQFGLNRDHDSSFLAKPRGAYAPHRTTMLLITPSLSSRAMPSHQTDSSGVEEKEEGLLRAPFGRIF